MSVIKQALRISSIAALFAFSNIALAQQAPSYGPSVSLEAARKVAAAANEEAKKNNWRVAIAIVDTAGSLVYYERIDDTQTGSPKIAIEKARTSAMFRRPSRVFEENVAQGRNAILGLPGVTPVTGGVPLMSNGQIVGAIGVSGVTSDQDEQVAKAGASVMK